MKKVFFIMLVSLMFAYANAQTSLKKAVDFADISTDGSIQHLFGYLDEGRPVVLFFYFNSCSSCGDAINKINQAYSEFTCNTGNAVFIAINAEDFPEQGISYKPDFPEINSTDIAVQYQVLAYPTTILILPDRRILKNDIWLMDPARSVFADLGIKPLPCNEEVLISGTQPLNIRPTYDVYPNPASEFVNIEINSGDAGDFSCNITDLSGRIIISEQKLLKDNKSTIDIRGLTPGVYFIKMQMNGQETVKKVVVY